MTMPVKTNKKWKQIGKSFETMRKKKQEKKQCSEMQNVLKKVEKS